MQDCSSFHSRNTLFRLKNVVKKGYCKNESLGLAWDCINVRQVGLFKTTFDCVPQEFMVAKMHAYGFDLN